MTRWNWVRILMILCIGCLLTTDLWAHRTSGPYGGYRERYSETPVVEKQVQSGRYEIMFCAFDMGHEVHMIAYARFLENGSYYQDMVRVSVLDPDGNALTVYRDHVVEVIDEPIRWAYRRPGLHTVSVELRPRAAAGGVGTAVTFTMPLARKSPTPIVLTSAAGVVMATVLAVVVLRRKMTTWRALTALIVLDTSG